MEKEEFIKKMIEYNYSDEEIEDTIQLVEELKAEGIVVDYKDFVLSKIE